MRKTSLILCAAVAFAFAGSPCEDRQYLDLKAKPLAALSPAETTYLMEYDRRCAEITQAVADSVRHEQTAAKIRRGAGAGVFFLVVAITAGIVIPIIWANHQAEKAQDIYDSYDY